MTPTNATRTTSTSAGHDDTRELALIARAERMRARDRRAGRFVKRCAKATLYIGVPVFLAWAIAMPNVVRSPCRGLQSEAKGNLKALYVAEESHRAEHDRYSVDAAALGFAPRGVRVRYDYLVRVDEAPRSEDLVGFEAFAVGRSPEVAGDVWRITNDNALEHVVDGCR